MTSQRAHPTASRWNRLRIQLDLITRTTGSRWILVTGRNRLRVQLDIVAQPLVTVLRAHLGLPGFGFNGFLVAGAAAGEPWSTTLLRSRIAVNAALST